MKCIHIIPSIAHEASGPSYSVPRLCESLVGTGIDLDLYTSDKKPTKEYGFPIHWFPPIGPFAYRLGRSPLLRQAIADAIPTADIIHNHSLWMMANIYPGRLIMNHRSRLVTSPRGTLSRWALRRSRFKKRLLWHAGQRDVLRQASLFHATCDAEHDDIRRLGYKQPIAVLPNGCDIPAPQEDSQPGSVRRMLYLGRIHPVKGLDNLVGAWASLGNETAEWELHLVGPGEKEHLRGLRRKIEQCGSDNIVMRNAAYGDSKSKEYFNANIYVLPSHSENFAMTVAEALAHGLPCIVSKGAPWAQLEKKGCGWWIDNDVNSIASALRAAMTKDTVSLKSAGLRGRDYVADSLSWNAIAMEMSRVYEWLIGGGQPPMCVRTY